MEIAFRVWRELFKNFSPLFFHEIKRFGNRKTVNGQLGASLFWVHYGLFQIYINSITLEVTLFY